MSWPFGLFVAMAGISVLWMALAALSLSRSRFARRCFPVEESPGHEFPRVDAVVPAHNERDHIEQTLVCLNSQEYPGLRINVVDDESTDDTAMRVRRIAESAGALDHPIQLIEGAPRPEGWVGKTWALEQGVEQSEAAWLWMVDADLWLHPRALATAMHEAETHQADFVSLLGMPRCETFWQRVIGIAIVHILSMLYPPRRVNDPGLPDAMAHGAFVLVRRSVYEKAGGIASVRNEIVEDIQFARRVKATGARIWVRPAPALVQTHMYGRFSEIWRGLRKNAYAGMDYAFHKYVTGALLALLFGWAPPLAMLVGFVRMAEGAGPTGLAWLIVGAVGWLGQALAAWPVVVFLGLRFPWGFSLPIGLSAYVAITTSSVWHYHRGRVLWKDRAFVAPRASSADQGP